MKFKLCPECEADISDTYEPAEPDVGIPTAGWYCDDCGMSFADHSE